MASRDDYRLLANWPEGNDLPSGDTIIELDRILDEVDTLRAEVGRLWALGVLDHPA